MIRNLKHYAWQFVEEDNTIVLIDKREKKTLVLSMAMADSFVRAYVSFKTRQRVNEKKALREGYQRRLEAVAERIGRLRVRLERKK